MRKTLLVLQLALCPGMLFAQQKGTMKAVMAVGKDIYEKRCSTCHQADATGAQNMIPPLINTGQVLGNKLQLITILLKGLNGEIKVNGDIYEGEMPAQKDLTDSEIAAVLTYVRNSFGNKASGVSVREVKKVREKLR